MGVATHIWKIKKTISAQKFMLINYRLINLNKKKLKGVYMCLPGSCLIMPLRIWAFSVLFGESECFLFLAWGTDIPLSTYTHKHISFIISHSVSLVMHTLHFLFFLFISLTLVLVKAAVADGGSEPVACLHLHCLDRLGIVKSWSLVSKTCPDVGPDSGRGRAGVVRWSFDTYSRASWFWVCASLTKEQDILRVVSFSTLCNLGDSYFKINKRNCC